MRCRALLLLLVTAACGRANAPAPAAHRLSAAMSIESPAFAAGGTIPAKYTCDGAGVSPPLVFRGVPASAKALALVVEDPDAPSGTFTHWAVWNLPPRSGGIAEGAHPDGVEGKNDFGKPGWGGPCPPSGEHHYVFTLYALDAPVGDRSGIATHTIDQGQLVATYRR